MGGWTNPPGSASSLRAISSSGSLIPEMPATERTEVRFLYDEDNLYVGARCWDSDASHLTVHELKQDFESREEDVLAILIDSLHDEQSGLFVLDESCRSAARRPDLPGRCAAERGLGRCLEREGVDRRDGLDGRIRDPVQDAALLEGPTAGVGPQHAASSEAQERGFVLVAAAAALSHDAPVVVRARSRISRASGRAATSRSSPTESRAPPSSRRISSHGTTRSTAASTRSTA